MGTNLPIGIAVLAGVSMTLGGYEAVEGAQDMVYGGQGDVYTESVNKAKDMLGEEVYYGAMVRKIGYWL